MPFTPPASDTQIVAPQAGGFRPPASDQQISPAASTPAPQPSAREFALAPLEQAKARAQEPMYSPAFMEAAGSRTTAEAGGAALGAGLGMAAGPPGMAAGSILGAMGGSAAYDAVGELMDFVRGKEPLGSNWERLGQSVDAMLEAGAWEAGTMGLMRLTMPAVRATGRLFTGVSQTQAPGVARAQALGLTPSAANIGTRAGPVSAGISRLPMVGNKSAERVTKQVDGLLERYEGALGTPMSRDEAANVVAAGGRKNALKLMDNYKAKYDAVRAISEKAGNPKAFSSRGMSDAARAFFGVVDEQAVAGATVGDLAALTRAAKPEDFLTGVAQLGDTALSYPQIAALRRTATRLQKMTDFSPALGAFRDEVGYRGLQDFLNATNDAIRNGRNLDIVQAWGVADDAFRNFKTFINQPQFSEFRRAVPGVEKRHVLNRPQTAERQDLLDLLVRERSPDNLRSFHTLVGEDGFSQIRSRAFMEDLNRAVQPSPEGGVRINAQLLKDAWGLNGKNPEGLARLEALLEGGQVSVGQVRQLADALELVGDQFLPQTSQFMARRLMLQTAGGGVSGGAHNIIGSLMLGGAGGSVASQGLGAAASGALYTLLGLRLFNSALTSPKVLNSMLKAVELHKANRPFEAFIRRALIQMERAEGGEGPVPTPPPLTPGATGNMVAQPSP